MLVPPHAKRGTEFLVTYDNTFPRVYVMLRKSEKTIHLLSSSTKRLSSDLPDRNQNEVEFDILTGKTTRSKQPLKVVKCLSPAPSTNDHGYKIGDLGCRKALRNYDALVAALAAWEECKKNFLLQMEILIDKEDISYILNRAEQLRRDKKNIFRFAEEINHEKPALDEIEISHLHLPTELHDKLYELGKRTVADLADPDANWVLANLDFDERLVIENILSYLPDYIAAETLVNILAS